MVDVQADWLAEVVREAGQLALSFYGRTTAKLKPDETWVTEADLAVEVFLREKIQGYRPKDFDSRRGDRSGAPFVTGRLGD